MDFYSVVAKLRNSKYYSEFFNKSSLDQLKKYLVTGFLSFGIEYSSFYILYKLIHMGYILANLVVYAAVFWLNFLMNRIWSFKSKDNLVRQLKLYSALFIFNMAAVNILLMYFLSDILYIPPLISKILLMGLVVCWNFILYKKVIYR